MALVGARAPAALPAMARSTPPAARPASFRGVAADRAAAINCMHREGSEPLSSGVVSLGSMAVLPSALATARRLSLATRSRTAPVTAYPGKHSVCGVAGCGLGFNHTHAGLGNGGSCGIPGCGVSHTHGGAGFGPGAGTGCGLCGGKGCQSCMAAGPGAGGTGCGFCAGKGCGKCLGLLHHLKLPHIGIPHHPKLTYFVGPGGPVPLTPGYVPYIVATRSPRDYFAFPPRNPNDP